MMIKIYPSPFEMSRLRVHIQELREGGKGKKKNKRVSFRFDSYISYIFKRKTKISLFLSEYSIVITTPTDPTRALASETNYRL